MPISRHPLKEEFPQYFSRLRDMKRDDPSFSALVSEYDVTDKKIYGLASKLLPVSDAHMGEFEDRRVPVRVDGDDQVGTLNADAMLDRAGNARGDVELWPNGLAGLADLAIGGRPALLDQRP